MALQGKRAKQKRHAAQWQSEDEVILDYRYVEDIEGQWSDSISMDLLPGVSIKAYLRFQRTHPNGTHTWVGRVEKEKLGSVILAETKGVVYGKIELDNGITILIQKSRRGKGYIIKHILTDNLREEGCIGLEPTRENKEEWNTSRGFGTGICDSAFTCDPDTVKVLVLYTDSARALFGGTDPAAQSAIAISMDELNTINVNSGVDHVFLLAHAQLTDYVESGSVGNDLDLMRLDNDMQNDTAHFLRDKYFADLVHMVVAFGGCGIANLKIDPNEFALTTAFSISDVDCFTGNKTFSHEIGHNLGMRHDIYADTFGGGPFVQLPCDFSFGYVNQAAFGGSIQQRWRTIMAIFTQCTNEGMWNCTRINYWSNPDMDISGDPLGVPIGTNGEANNSFIMERSVCEAANYRTEPPCPECAFQIGCAPYNFIGLEVTNTNVPFYVDSFDRASPFGDSMTVCVTTFGDHGSASEVFELLSEEGDFIGLSGSTGGGATDDCGVFLRECYKVSPGLYNQWILDGELHFELDPLNDNIDNFGCSANRACVELLVPQDFCHPGGIYTGVGQSGEFLPSGTYTFTSEVTLRNFRVPAGERVVLRSNFDINLDDDFTVEEGAFFETVEGGCN
jgi:hypothetical protein